MWSIERYLIARDCGLRLALKGTVSTSSPVVSALRSGLITGVIPEIKAVHAESMRDVLARILNTARKADSIIPSGTRVYWDDNGVNPGSDLLRVTLDFACVTGDAGCFYYVSRKKMGGTPPVIHSYTLIGASIRHLYPAINKVYVREILLNHLYMDKGNTSAEFDLLPVPPVEVDISDEAVQVALKDVLSSIKDTESRSDRRKCRVGSDPCPAYDICPVINPKQ